MLAQYGVPVNPVAFNLADDLAVGTRTGPATTNNYLSNGRNDYNSYNGIVKIDHRFSDKHSIFGALFRRNGHADRGCGLPHPRLLPGGAKPHAQHFDCGKRASSRRDGEPVDAGA